jgi:glycosyltransferase involved in cell wall biosynthesis
MGMPDAQSLGGPAACEPPFAAELRRLGAEVTEETYVYGGKLSQTRLRQRIVRVLGTARRLSRCQHEAEFDIIHLNSSFDKMALLRDAATLRFLRPTRARIFVKFHGSDAALFETNSPVLRSLVRFVLARVDGIGLLSAEERENFRRAGVDGEKLFVVKNVVAAGCAEEAQPELQAEQEQSENLRAKLRVDAQTPLLLFIARFIPAKGLTDVLDACAILREEGRAFHLLCLGDGEARAAAEAQTARLRLNDLVRFFGYVPEAETREFYAGSTMLVFPTYHYEGFPMVIFKSVAAGLPIITTRIRAAADYLSEPDHCLWVAQQNPRMLAEKIIQLLDQPDRCAAMRRNNLELARQFTARVVAPEYLEIYNQLIKT